MLPPPFQLKIYGGMPVGFFAELQRLPFSNRPHSPSPSYLQGHKASLEPDPQVLLAPWGNVALQVARVLLGWGDHQDPLDTATLLSVLAFLTTDKDTQVHTVLSRSCMVLYKIKN